MELRIIIAIAVIAVGVWFAIEAVKGYIGERREFMARKHGLYHTNAEIERVAKMIPKVPK